MCLVALSFAGRPDRPLLLAANREEFFARPALAPAVQAGGVLCGTDARAGGTWLGGNEHGLLVAVTNRAKERVPLEPRSRGLVCRELLTARSASEAHERALQILGTGSCAGCNFVCVDRTQGWVIHAGDVLEAIPLTPGLHLLANRDLNDPHDGRLSRVRAAWNDALAEDSTAFVAWAKEVCAWRAGSRGEPPIVLKLGDRGTVSSSIITLTAEAARSEYWHSVGPPDVTGHEDFSAEWRRVLSR